MQNPFIDKGQKSPSNPPPVGQATSDNSKLAGSDESPEQDPLAVPGTPAQTENFDQDVVISRDEIKFEGTTLISDPETRTPWDHTYAIENHPVASAVEVPEKPLGLEITSDDEIKIEESALSDGEIEEPTPKTPMKILPKKSKTSTAVQKDPLFPAAPTSKPPMKLMPLKENESGTDSPIQEEPLISPIPKENSDSIEPEAIGHFETCPVCETEINEPEDLQTGAAIESLKTYRSSH